MEKRPEQLFKNIGQAEPSLGLEQAIFRRIEAEEAKKLSRQLAISRLAAIGSGVLTALAILTMGQQFIHSEFASVLSLIFSDLSMVARNWSDFGLSLLETFPTVTLIVILIPLFALFLSFGSYLDINNHKHKYI